MEEKKNALNSIEPRIKYYLLDWKDRNMETYLQWHPNKRLNDLSFKELHDLFFDAAINDIKYLLNKFN